MAFMPSRTVTVTVFASDPDRALAVVARCPRGPEHCPRGPAGRGVLRGHRCRVRPAGCGAEGGGYRPRGHLGGRLHRTESRPSDPLTVWRTYTLGSITSPGGSTAAGSAYSDILYVRCV